MKRLFRFLAPLLFIAGSIPAANAAGTIPFSLSQQFDALGKPLGGCRLFTIAAGTVSTPQDAFQDAGLTIKLPNPIECDASGRLPQFFLADGNIKVRLTDKNGVTQIVADNILVIGPSSGGGGGGGGQVDPTTIIQTGDVKYRYGTGSLSGFVRANGRTIGSASSGASERANADCQALFEYLWGADATLVVSGGRGASAAADWAANKTIALPDFRGRVLAGMDTMGAASADRLNPSITSGILGSSGGSRTISILQTNLPAVNFAVYIPAGQGWHTHGTSGTLYSGTPSNRHSGIESGNLLASPFGIGISGNTLPAMSGTAASGGSGAAIASIPPTSVVTLYIKL